MCEACDALALGPGSQGQRGCAPAACEFRCYIVLAAYRDSPPRLKEAERANVWAVLARLAGGDPAFNVLFGLSLFFLASLAKQVPWPGGRGGGIPFLCGVERASQPGMAPGEGGWESPSRASDLRRMSCVWTLARRVWSTCRVQALLVPCRKVVLPWVGRRVFGEGADEGFQRSALALRGGPTKECKRTKQELPVLVLTSTSYWVSKITYIPSIRSPAPGSRARRLLACKVSG